MIYHNRFSTINRCHFLNRMYVKLTQDQLTTLNYSEPYRHNIH